MQSSQIVHGKSSVIISILPVKLRKVNFCPRFTQLINDLRGFNLGVADYTAVFAPIWTDLSLEGPLGNLVFLMWALSTLGLPVFVYESRRTGPEVLLMPDSETTAQNHPSPPYPANPSILHNPLISAQTKETSITTEKYPVYKKN